MIGAADDPEYQARLAAFQQGLQNLGWTDSRNLQIDTRWTAGDAERIRKNVAELVALAPDAILAPGSVAAGDPRRADCVRACRRCCGCRLRPYPGAARGQRYRF